MVASSSRRYRALQCGIAAVVLALSASLAFAGSAAVGANQSPDALSIWRVQVSAASDAQRLLSEGYDLVEGRGSDYFLVIGEDTVAAKLREDGFAVALDRSLAPAAALPSPDTPESRSVAFFGGYRSVAEHNEHLSDVVAAHPELATVYDYGDSWNKINARAGSNDLMVICLTNKQPGDCELDPDSTKPRAVIQAAIHARELQTSEVAWRLIDELTDLYGADGDITHMMDTVETWIIPIVNPDGREIVESGGNNPYLQRKNANDTVGACARPPTASDHHGVDLNRNATWGWGGAGVSSNPCAQTYNGTGPASEPEQLALEDLFASLWPAQKGPDSADPVPLTATGSFITIHSYGELILIPQAEDALAPNDAEMRKFAFRMSHYNGYVTGTGTEVLYGVSGSTDDHAYFAYGVPSFTYELSPVSGACSGFTPNYGCVDSEIWPTNRDALLYAIKVAGAPYVAPQGPTTIDLEVPGSIKVGGPLTIAAMSDDDAYGNAAGSFGRPTAVAVSAMEYYLDVPPSAGGSPVSMNPTDGSFDNSSESGVATIDTTGLSPGRHSIYVRARNGDGFWGPITAAHFEAIAPGDADCSGGALTTGDAQLLIDYLVGSRSGASCPLSDPDTQLNLAGADVSGDGHIDLLDALIVARCAAGANLDACPTPERR